MRPVRRPFVLLLPALMAAPLWASTEADPLAVSLRALDDGAVQVRVVNRSDDPVEAWVRTREAGGEALEAQVRLEPGQQTSWRRPWGEGERFRVRAGLVGSSAYTQDRLFQTERGRVDLAGFLQASGPGALRTTSGAARRVRQAGVRGRVLFPTHGGELAPLGDATVSLGGAQARVDAAGHFELSGVAPGPGDLVVSLRGPHWTVKPRSGGAYSYTVEGVEVPAEGGLDLGELQLPAGQPVTEAAWIHDVARRARAFLQRTTGDTSWWGDLPIHWPSNGDYFSWGSLHITQAHRWDVIGHELGHAVYFAAGNFAGGGGPHKIDECYSEGLALSEGWATFFSGALFFQRDEPDAKFEFLVPRRAPIRLENVPEDVCPGQRNEWRVAAMFWDFYDTHVDGGDEVGLSWGAASWDLLRSGRRVRKGAEARDRIAAAAGDQGDAVRASATHNTID